MNSMRYSGKLSLLIAYRDADHKRCGEKLDPSMSIGIRPLRPSEYGYPRKSA